MTKDTNGINHTNGEEARLLERINAMDESTLASDIVPIRDVCEILGSRCMVEILTGVASGYKQELFGGEHLPNGE